jgi:type II secretory ATPase GspE/PulE/Tfp pilus assembly ATPase PilB-like protein
MDMGIEPYLLASSIIGVIGQRLVRAVCPRCKKTDSNVSESLKSLQWDETQENWSILNGSTNFVYGAGCSYCLSSGYRGRKSIFEMLEMDTQLQHVLSVEPEKTMHYLSTQKIRTLQQDGLLSAAEGLTTIEEVLRVTG